MLHQFMKEKKSFKYEVCGYSYSKKSNLKTHVETVHEGKKAFKCAICDYSFSQKVHGISS